MVAVVALAWKAEATRAGGAGEVDRDRGQGEPGGVGGEPAAGQVRKRPGLKVGDDLLDDRVPAVLGLGLEQLDG